MSSSRKTNSYTINPLRLIPRFTLIALGLAAIVIPMLQASATTASNSLLSSIPLFPNATFAPIAENHPYIMAQVIDDVNKECVEKQSAVAGNTKGKVCQIQGDTFIMKPAKWPDYRLDEVFNLEVAKNNIGIRVPNVSYFWLNKTLYIASQKISDFKMATTLRNSEQSFTQTVSQTLSQQDIAKLYVSISLFDDLKKLENWGYDANNNLILIDIDHKTPIKNHLRMAQTALSYKYDQRNVYNKQKGVIDLSMQNIADMIEIYQKMLDKPLNPVIQAIYMVPAMGVDFGLAQRYKPLLRAYIEACQIAGRMLIEKKVDYTQALQSNNEVLSEAFMLVNQRDPSFENDPVSQTAEEEVNTQDFPGNNFIVEKNAATAVAPEPQIKSQIDAEVSEIPGFKPIEKHTYINPSIVFNSEKIALALTAVNIALLIFLAKKLRQAKPVSKLSVKALKSKSMFKHDKREDKQLEVVVSSVYTI